jgi:spermidine synthase
MALQALPFVYEEPATRALHFSISEIQSRMRLGDPCALDLEYTRVMMGFLLFDASPGCIGIIGLGGGSLPKFCHRYLPDSRIRVVETNPHVIAMRAQFHVPPDDERFIVTQCDGAHFVRSPPERLDVLLVDGFDSDGLPLQLSSQRFYDRCFAALKPRGVMVANLPAGHRLHAVHLERIRRSFAGAMFVVDNEDGGNLLVFGLKGYPAAHEAPALPMRPDALAPQAWRQLMPSFGRVIAAMSQVTKGSNVPPARP